MPHSADDGDSVCVTSIHALETEYQLDGFDFETMDDGLPCNERDENDVSNFSLFLQHFRAKGGGVTLSATVGLTPFNSGEYGVPMFDVYALLVPFLDYVTLMAYNVWSPSSTPPLVGPNAPLAMICMLDDRISSESAETAVAACTKAGMPARKILMGVPRYGHRYEVEPSAAIDASGMIDEYPAFNQTAHPLGDAWDVVLAANATDTCGSPVFATGYWYFHNLVNAKDGVLTANGTAREGISYRYDNCTQTPYAYNKIMVSYDDTASCEAKGRFVQQMRLGGFALWEAAGDYNDVLLDAILDGVR